MPRFKHYISMEYVISKEYYRGEEFELAGTGQGNKFSGDMYRDVSYIIIRVIENNLLRVLFANKTSKEIIQCAAIVFADDTDFMTDEKEAQRQMQQMLDIYNRLHRATGGQIEETKITFQSWQWKWKQGQKIIQNIENELIVNNKKLE